MKVEAGIHGFSKGCNHTPALVGIVKRLASPKEYPEVAILYFALNKSNTMCLTITIWFMLNNFSEWRL